MKIYRLMVVCFILFFSIPIVPINPEQPISQGLGSAAILDPPKVMNYISPDIESLGIEYDMFRNYTYLATLIFDPLVEYSFDTEELIPALAKQWVVSNDSKHWIFTLREDIKFHDGTNFNASSVKFTYDRFIDPAHPAYLADPILELSDMPLESVEVLGEYEVSINFNQSYAPFIYHEAAYCGIYSPESFQGGSDIIVPIGTGPYYLDEVVSNASYQRFIRNDKHFRGVPPFEEVQFFPIDSWEGFQTLVEADVGDFTTISVNSISENDNYWDEQLGSTAIHYAYFNHLRPIVNDKNVRLAINYAINKQRYVNQKFKGSSIGVKPLRSVIYSEDPYHDESISGYPYNVDLANEILDNAGYPRNEEGYRFNIDLVGFDFYYENIESIKADLEQIGIHCTISYATSMTNLYTGNFDLFLFGWGPIMDPSLTRKLLHTAGDINFGGYSNPEIDLYTTLGQQTPVRQEREYYYQLVQQIAQEDAPLLLLQEVKKINLRSKRVAPFIKLSKIGRIMFDYSTQVQISDIYKMENIEVSSDPVYFPLTDGLVSLQNQQFKANMTMTHELNNIISGQQESGKFYEFQVSDTDLEYQIRCYYDLDEIHSSLQSEEQELFLWNYSTQSWDKLETLASDDNLRFSEVQLKGNAILRLSQWILSDLTFRYLPIVIIIIGPIISLTTIVIIKNRKLSKRIKEEYDLT